MAELPSHADLATLGRPAGFPRCHRCPFRDHDRPEVCLESAAPWSWPGERGPVCGVCEQMTGSDGQCANDWCGRADRWFSLVWTIAPHMASLRNALAEYKYRDRRGWADVFARLFVGYLDEHMPWFDDYDLITGVPVYLGPGANRSWDHIGLILAEAGRLAGPRWPIDRHVVTKAAETTPMAGLGRWRRRACAEGQLRRALVVPDRDLVAGLRILVIDDVFTEGSTLREVARALTLSGAIEVAGLALARQPWGVDWAGPTRRSARPGGSGYGPSA
jgi:predicted amidophosphoribosyltransferase